MYKAYLKTKYRADVVAVKTLKGICISGMCDTIYVAVYNYYRDNIIMV